MDDTIRCYYCDCSSEVFGDIIKHAVNNHENNTLKAKLESTTETYTRNFGIIPREELEKGKVIIPNEDTRTVKISRLIQTPTPVVKVSKKLKKQVTSTPKRLDFEIEANEILMAEKIQNMSIEDIEPLEPMCDETDSLIDEIQTLLPSVIETVRKENQEDMYLKFNRLLAENKLPVTNIAYLLFKDIVEWYSLDHSTSMRYSPEVKKF